MKDKINTKKYLNLVLNNKIFVPTRSKTEQWEIQKNCSKIEIYNKLKKFLVPDSKVLGFTETNLPSKEFLLRTLKEINKDDEIFVSLND